MLSTSISREFQEIGFWPEGRSLREALADGERPDRAMLVDWGCQLLESLAVVHAQGLLHGHLNEDEVFLTPGGRLLLSGCTPAPLFGNSCSVQSDLYAAGCLLRRLAFAASLPGGRRLGARDPLVKVLARATFANPAARYQSAAEMAEALREAGRTVVGTGPRRLDGSHRTGSRVAEFPGSPRRPRPVPAPAPPQNREDREDRELWHALVLLVVALLMMTFLLVTGWVILDRDTGGWRTGGLPSPHPLSLPPPATVVR